MTSAIGNILERLRTGTMARRLAEGVAANVLGRAWLLIVQLLSIPILVSHWGVEGYGAWLMLVTIPTYILLSDFGFGTAASVELTRKSANHDVAGSLEIFHSAWIVLTTMSLGIGIVVFLAASAMLNGLPAEDIAHFGNLHINLALVVVYALLTMQTQLPLLVFRATKKYALGTLLFDTLVFGEGLLQLGSVAIGGNITTSLAVLLVTRLVTLFVCYLVLRRDEGWVRLGISHARWATIRHLIGPSSGAVALNLANSLVIQGVLLTLGMATGTAAVAVFATSRFIARAPLLFSGFVTRASIPEITRAIEVGQIEQGRRLVQLNIGVALLFALPASIVLLLFGPQLLRLLSGGKILGGPEIFVPLVLGATVSTIWAGLATPLIATNRHSRFSYVYLAVSVGTVAVPFVASSQAASSATAWAMAVSELVVLAVVWVQLRRTLSL